jgi:RNA polymerase sigma-70 factor (ECF subfamily)
MKRRDKSDRQVEWDEERPDDAAEVGPGAGPAESLPDPHGELERAELRRSMLAAVEGLPEEARRTFLLREVDGLSYAEIARTLHIPKGTVMSRLHYARRRLRDALIEAGAVLPSRDRDGAGTTQGAEA